MQANLKFSQYSVQTLSLKIAYHHSLTEEEKSKEQEVSEEHPIVNLWVLKH